MSDPVNRRSHLLPTGPTTGVAALVSRHSLHSIWHACQSTFDQLLPDICAHQLSLCEDPWEPDPPTAWCHRCGYSAGPGAATARGCPHCLGHNLPWNSVTRLAVYKPPVRDWIISMKFGGAWSWCRYFGQQLARRLPLISGQQPIIVVPVPMPWRRRWMRGYNQAQLIGQTLAHQRAWPFELLLSRTRQPRPQSVVPLSLRRQNVADSFTLPRVDLSGVRIILVDDVMTTGATLRACARLLRQAGAEQIHIAVTAVTDPRTSPRPLRSPQKHP